MELENLPKKNPFPTPEGYFEQLPFRLQKRLEKKPIFWTLPKLVAVPSLALSIFVIAFFGQKQQDDLGLDHISDQVLAQYLLEQDIKEIEIISYQIPDWEKVNTPIPQEVLEQELENENLEELL